MTVREILKRASATFIAGATAAPLIGAAFDVTALKALGIAGAIAVFNMAGRLAQTWLAEHPEAEPIVGEF